MEDIDSRSVAGSSAGLDGAGCCMTAAMAPGPAVDSNLSCHSALAVATVVEAAADRNSRCMEVEECSAGFGLGLEDEVGSSARRRSSHGMPSLE